MQTLKFGSLTTSTNGDEASSEEKECRSRCIEKGVFSVGSYLENYILPNSVEAVGWYAFERCSEVRNCDGTVHEVHSINFLYDINRGGRKFLQRCHYDDDDNNDDDKQDNKKTSAKYYPSSLWPVILNCVINEIEYPAHKMFGHHDSINGYTNEKSIRRVRIVYYLMTSWVGNVVLVVTKRKQKGNKIRVKNQQQPRSCQPIVIFLEQSGEESN